MQALNPRPRSGPILRFSEGGEADRRDDRTFSGYTLRHPADQPGIERRPAGCRRSPGAQSCHGVINFRAAKRTAGGRRVTMTPGGETAIRCGLSTFDMLAE